MHRCARIGCYMENHYFTPWVRRRILRLQTTSVSCVPAPFPHPTLRSSFGNSRRLVTLGQICTRDGTVATSAGGMTVRSRPDQGHQLFFPPLSDSFTSFKRAQAYFFF
ncbi:uncharacterized protein TrAFT101_003810 [Trichoderma asperellum]|uniref:uncharacterized protein n=1 Tax=Trichoderma asperellum TaxID=101201 RepID=UPI00332B351E|nr:hypothetical protein TrAFT101_003810 [Trichoderma asperellum]